MNLSITLFLIRISLVIIPAFSAYNFYYYTETMEFVFSIFVPIMIYPNAETNETNILLDNKSKAGIYQWKHNKSGKFYIGSAIDLAKRLKKYYFPSELKRVDNIICRALLLHGHSEFSLTIFENVDISNKSKDEAKTLVLEREQHYLDTLLPVYNILKKAGNSYGYKHSPESLAKLSGENHPMFGKTHSAESLTKISEALSE
jgi:excinuclease UvrABC nuclease subunit